MTHFFFYLEYSLPFDHESSCLPTELSRPQSTSRPLLLILMFEILLNTSIQRDCSKFKKQKKKKSKAQLKWVHFINRGLTTSVRNTTTISTILVFKGTAQSF